MTDQSSLDTFLISQPDAGARRPAGPYFAHVADTLLRQAADLGQAWAMRGAGAISGVPANADGSAAAAAAELVRTLVGAALGGDWHESVMRTGWASGTRAFWRGVSLYQLLKELDGGVTLLLSAADAATREYPGTSSASDGIAVARRIADAASLLRLAAAGAYTRALSDELRDRYRTIRHDLRNPLGTITSAVALMEDESVPEAMRKDPRMRAMLARNARSMEAMIAAALGDSAAELPAIARQSTSIRELACAVRGDLSAAADGVNVIVGQDLPTFPLDSTGLELLLKAVVMAIARAASCAVDVVIGLESLGSRDVTLAVYAQNLAQPVVADVGFARELVARLGGRVAVAEDGRVLIEVPVEPQAGVSVRDRPVREPGAIPPRGDASGGDSRDDVAGERDRPDGESRRFQ